MMLEGKVAIVTGGASGIGRACAERFAHEGARVVIVDVAEEDGAAAAQELTDQGFEVRFVLADVGQRLDGRNLLAATLGAYDAVDILVNNAAIMDDASFLDIDEAEFDAVMQVNLKGPFLLAQAVARQMLAQIEAGRDPGTIINMASVNAVFALPDHVAYSISKGAVVQMTRAMALALAPHGIRVNAVGPGSVKTPMLNAITGDEAATRRVLSRTPLGRFAEPREIAGVAAFLASEDASYLTGTVIYADGGRLPLNLTVDVAEAE